MAQNQNVLGQSQSVMGQVKSNGTECINKLMKINLIHAV